MTKVPAAHLITEIDRSEEMSTLLLLYNQMKAMNKEGCESIGISLDLQGAALLPAASHSVRLPPPLKYVRRRKTSSVPPKGPSCIQVETEPTTSSASCLKDEYDRRLEYLLRPCNEGSFQ